MPGAGRIDHLERPMRAAKREEVPQLGRCFLWVADHQRLALPAEPKLGIEAQVCSQVAVISCPGRLAGRRGLSIKAICGVLALATSGPRRTLRTTSCTSSGTSPRWSYRRSRHRRRHRPRVPRAAAAPRGRRCDNIRRAARPNSAPLHSDPRAANWAFSLPRGRPRGSAKRQKLSVPAGRARGNRTSPQSGPAAADRPPRRRADAGPGHRSPAKERRRSGRKLPPPGTKSGTALPVRYGTLLAWIVHLDASA